MTNNILITSKRKNNTKIISNMRKLYFAFIMLFLLAFTSMLFPQTVEITIKTNLPGKPISPDLMGVFFEDLNYAADGGVYAELVQNRSFEYSPTERSDWHPLKFWDLIKLGDANGKVQVANMRPIHKNNPLYAILTVNTPGEGVGIANLGFDCMPVIKGEKYNASFWAYQAYMGKMWRDWKNTDPMPVSIQLETKDGEILAKKSFEIVGREWTKFTAELIPSKTIQDARIVLMAYDQGAICVDMISLFPEKTFKNRKNGLRNDIAQTIADIHPKFIRFPGGCLVHGQGIHQYYDWKESVGPVEQRKSCRNLWGYDQTRGFGYYEFFQYCEDINAIPLPVVTAGVSCQHSGSTPSRGQEGLPLDEMPDYIQDVLDLIEWANGSADSKWGTVRAEAGHPEPFGLKYLGVGNEDAITPIFKERFKMIYNVLKEKHPEIVVVGTVGPFAEGEDYDNGWEFAKELNLEMVDEHYYLSPQWFWDNLNRYDAYQRNATKVYVGEYAAHDKGRKNTLRSAIAEAAMLTSFERNADVIQFASYAPLLARRKHTQWHPDLIYFDSTNVYPSANYYVQQLFGQNSGDKYIETNITTPDSIKLAASTVKNSETGELIVKIVNGEENAKTIQINLEGINLEEKLGVTKIVLTGSDADSYNDDGVSEIIAPKLSSESVSSSFIYEAPANSLTVFKVK